MRSTPSEPQGPSATTQVVQPAGDGVQVSMVRYPRPERAAKLWSQWGQGLVLPDGRFVSAMGDHARRRRQQLPVRLRPGDRAHHPDRRRALPDRPRAGRMGIREGPRADRRGADVATRTSRRTGGPEPTWTTRRRIAAMCCSASIRSRWSSRSSARRSRSTGSRRSRVPDDWVSCTAKRRSHSSPDLGREQGAFFVYDTESERVIFRSDDVDHALFRNVMVDAAGRAYVAREDGGLLMYEPGADRLVALDASSRTEGCSGRALDRRRRHRVRRDPTARAGGRSTLRTVRVLTRARGPRSRTCPRLHGVARARSANEMRFFYVPGAHGDSSTQGTPVIAVDTATGEQQVIARLNELAERTSG